MPLPPLARSSACRAALVALPLLLLALLLALPAGPAAAASTGPAEVFRVAPGSGKIALTFDGADWPGRITDILTTLRAHHARATFFLTGGYLIHWPRTTRMIANAGMEIANHSYDHVDFTGLSDGAIRNEVRAQEALYTRTTGLPEIHYWRPPYGAVNSRVLNVVSGLGWRTIMWSLDSLDTGGAPKSAAYIFNRLTSPSRSRLDGGILLLHVNPNGTVDALPRVLNYLGAIGLQPVTVGDLLGDTGR